MTLNVSKYLYIILTNSGPTLQVQDALNVITVK